jgi:hypothetical protein
MIMNEDLFQQVIARFKEINLPNDFSECPNRADFFNKGAVLIVRHFHDGGGTYVLATPQFPISEIWHDLKLDEP